MSATYLILKVFNGGLVIAVGYATFAALIGAFGGLVVLYIYWNKRKGSLLAMMPNTGPTANLSYKKMFFELFSYAAPYVFVGLAIPLYNYIDTNTFNKAMIEAGHQAISHGHAGDSNPVCAEARDDPGFPCNSFRTDINSNDY